MRPIHFAYVDGKLAHTRALVNLDDPSGTKYLEIVSNGMPVFFISMLQGTLALLRGLMRVDAPPTYDQMLADVDGWQVVNVTGEEDNAYDPGDGDGPWTGLDESSTVSKNAEKHYSAPRLPTGHYVFRMTGTGESTWPPPSGCT